MITSAGGTREWRESAREWRESGRHQNHARRTPSTPYRYVSDNEDSARWTGFPFREGDIIISTRSRSGTTWTQMICALLVFGTPDLPRPLGELSPWLDHLITPRDTVVSELEAQSHRRFIKTHTPLDGLPVDRRATYLVVLRHPLDTAVSLYYQAQDIDWQRLRELTGVPEPSEPEEPMPGVREWLLQWIADDVDPRRSLDSLPGIMLHLRDAWRRREQSNVLLFHYDDLSNDLDGQMRRLAEQLGITVPELRWGDLVDAATFACMKNRAAVLIPNTGSIFKNGAAFFRKGRSGAGRELLTAEELAAYHKRIAGLAPTDALAWLHGDP